MFCCDKCGTHFNKKNKLCPTCGLVIENEKVINNFSNNKIFNILIIIILLLGLFVGIFIFLNSYVFIGEKIEIFGDRYSITYKSDNWKEIDSENNDYFLLQNTNDLNVVLQIPLEVNLLSVNNLDEDDLEELCDNYKKFLNSDNVYNYSNISLKFNKLKDKNKYYMKADFHKKNDSSFQGRVYILVSTNGKMLNIVLKRGITNISSVHNDVLEILNKIEI